MRRSVLFRIVCVYTLTVLKFHEEHANLHMLEIIKYHCVCLCLCVCFKSVKSLLTFGNTIN